MNIKLKRGIFLFDVCPSGAFIVLGIDSNIGSIVDNNSFNKTFIPYLESYINPHMGTRWPHHAQTIVASGRVDIGSELEQQL